VCVCVSAHARCILCVCDVCVLLVGYPCVCVCVCPRMHGLKKKLKKIYIPDILDILYFLLPLSFAPHVSTNTATSCLAKKK